MGRGVGRWCGGDSGGGWPSEGGGWGVSGGVGRVGGKWGSGEGGG